MRVSSQFNGLFISYISTANTFSLGSYFTEKERNSWRNFISSLGNAILSILLKYQEINVRIIESLTRFLAGLNRLDFLLVLKSSCLLITEYCQTVASNLSK